MNEQDILALRQKAMDTAVSLCEGRYKDNDEAYNADEIAAEAQTIFTFLSNTRAT